MTDRVDIYKCDGIDSIKKHIFLGLQQYEAILPKNKNALILLKPNLNSNMNALTGNTTDLRILVSVIEFLKIRGYNKIVIGEGTSSGFYRLKINIFSRLYIDKIAEKYGLDIVDLNYAPYTEIEFENGTKAKIAKICLECDFMISLPKLKTHFETMISCCLKNLIGTLVGVHEKQKAHQSLYRNILNLNKKIKPNLHIVDALIPMEGTGPSAGIPINVGAILFGTNPYLIDLLCTKITGIDYKDVPTLRIAEEKGIINNEYHKYVDSINLNDLKKSFKRPKVNFMVLLINDQRWQYKIVKFRLSKPIDYLCSTKIVSKILNSTGLRQDVFVEEETVCKKLYVDYDICDYCGKCKKYCPSSLDLPSKVGDVGDSGCFKCLYCYLVCPVEAIKFEGKLGFLSGQLKQYNKLTREIT